MGENSAAAAPAGSGTGDRIGLIGVGLMGHGIAASLLRHGREVGFLRHPGNQPAADLVAAGARGVDSVADLAGQSEVILLCVTGTPQVEDVLLGSGRLLEVLRPGMMVIDCSTALPGSTVQLAAQVAKTGAVMIDAAMTRTPKEAAEGRLNLLVGASGADFERARPLLECFAENITHAGLTGAGHRLKLVHNFVSLGMATLLAEAAACADAGGIAPEVLVDCLRKGGGHGAALERMAPAIIKGETAQLRFTIGNAGKDLGYYREMAEAEGVPHRIADGILQTLQALVEAGAGDLLIGDQVRLLQRKTDPAG